MICTFGDVDCDAIGLDTRKKWQWIRGFSCVSLDLLIASLRSLNILLRGDNDVYILGNNFNEGVMIEESVLQRWQEMLYEEVSDKTALIDVFFPDGLAFCDINRCQIRDWGDAFTDEYPKLHISIKLGTALSLAQSVTKMQNFRVDPCWRRIANALTHT